MFFFLIFSYYAFLVCFWCLMKMTRFSRRIYTISSWLWLSVSLSILLACKPSLHCLTICCSKANWCVYLIGRETSFFLSDSNARTVLFVYICIYCYTPLSLSFFVFSSFLHDVFFFHCNEKTSCSIAASCWSTRTLALIGWKILSLSLQQVNTAAMTKKNIYSWSHHASCIFCCCCCCNHHC